MAKRLSRCPSNTLLLPSASSAPKKRNHRRARDRIDRRYAVGKRVEELEHALKAYQLGSDDSVMLSAIKRCASLAVARREAKSRISANARPESQVHRQHRSRSANDRIH